MNHKNLARRRAICRFIREYTQEHGYSPSYRDLSEQLHMAGLAHVHYFVHLLAREGLLLHDDYIQRSIRLTEAGLALANEEEPDNAPPAA